MGVVSYGAHFRRAQDEALLVCDHCDSLLLPPGRETPRSFRASEPADLASLALVRGEIAATAMGAEWAQTRSGIWSCRNCRPLIHNVPDENRLRARTILVAEDNEDCRELLIETLTSFGARCLASESGDSAFGLFEQHRPDILLSDLRMADGDGFELIRRIRALPASRGGLTPALAVSAEPCADEALTAGYHVFVAKPFDIAALVGVLGEFLRSDDEVPSAQASWTVSSPAPGTVSMVFVGYMRPADVRSAMAVLLRHLEQGSCDVIADLSKVTGYSLAAPSAAERAVWTSRHSIRHVHVIGGSRFTRLVASACCRVLGLAFTLESDGAHHLVPTATGASL